RIRLACCELGTEVTRAPVASSQLLRTSSFDHVNLSHSQAPWVAGGGIRPDTASFQDRVFSLVSAEIRKYLGSSLSEVECQLSSGAKHRFATTTKLNAASRLCRSRRSRGFHSGYKLLRRLLCRTIA